ncbi:MAG: hypothetical protein ACRDZR_07675 [Acidimicrobiales bacterium]
MTRTDPVAEDRASYDEDLSGHIARGKVVDRPERSQEEPKSAFALRLSATTIDALRELAAARGTTISELVRGWIVDRLAIEALQPTGADPAVWAAATRAALEAVPQIAAETAERLAKAG